MAKKLFYKSGALYCLIQENKREYFYENGTPKTVENYLDSRLDGEILLYWPNGKLKRKCSFQKGLRHGLDQMWDEASNLADAGSYEKGKPVGVHRRWRKGDMIEEISHV